MASHLILGIEEEKSFSFAPLNFLFHISTRPFVFGDMGWSLGMWGCRREGRVLLWQGVWMQKLNWDAPSFVCWNGRVHFILDSLFSSVFFNPTCQELAFRFFQAEEESFYWSITSYSMPYSLVSMKKINLHHVGMFNAKSWHPMVSPLLSYKKGVLHQVGCANLVWG